MKVIVCDMCRVQITGLPQGQKGEPAVPRVVALYPRGMSTPENHGTMSVRKEVCGECFRKIEHFIEQHSEALQFS